MHPGRLHHRINIGLAQVRLYGLTELALEIVGAPSLKAGRRADELEPALWPDIGGTFDMGATVARDPEDALQQLGWRQRLGHHKIGAAVARIDDPGKLRMAGYDENRSKPVPLSSISAQPANKLVAGFPTDRGIDNDEILVRGEDDPFGSDIRFAAVNVLGAKAGQDLRGDPDRHERCRQPRSPRPVLRQLPACEAL